MKLKIKVKIKSKSFYTIKENTETKVVSLAALKLAS